VTVHAFNQRTVAEILDVIRMLGALVGAGDRAAALVADLSSNNERIKAETSKRKARPKVYFEEWDDPMISGIAWVSELIGIAGGDDIFAELSGRKLAKDRIVSSQDVIARSPDIIIGSWCGKKFSADKLSARVGFGAIPAVRNRRVLEIKSPLILQPGPAALTAGLEELCRAIDLSS
jgi:iron complex transport system substrate-binding protein